MTREQALAFLGAFNAMQPYVPPINFMGAAQSDVMRIILAVANGQATCEVKFDLAAVPKVDAPKTDASAAV